MFIIFVSVTNISAFTSALIPRVALSLPPVFFIITMFIFIFINFITIIIVIWTLYQLMKYEQSIKNCQVQLLVFYHTF